MRKKNLFKIIAGIGVLICAGLVYTYAQKNTGGQKEEDIEKAELPGTATNDDPWKEMDKLVHAYYGENGFSYKGSLKLIDDNGEQEKVIEEHPFECAFLRNEFQYSLDSVEIINQDQYVMVVDHRRKVVSLSATGRQSTGSQLFDMEQFKKMMLEQKADAAVTQLENEKMLTIENIQHPQIQGYRIYYDPKTYKINKMLIGVLRFSPLSDDEEYIESEKATENKSTGMSAENEEPGEEEIDAYTYYVEIEYKQSNELNKGDFNPLQKFVRIDKNKIGLQPGYNHYQLLNTTAQTE